MKTTFIINGGVEPRCLYDTANSVFGQDVPPDQIVVCHDATDAQFPRQFTARYPLVNIPLVFSGKDAGAGVALESLLSLCHGDLLFFAESGDLFEAPFVGSVKRFFAENRSCDLLECAYHDAGAGGRPVRSFRGDADLGFSVVESIFCPVVYCRPVASLVVRRQFLDVLKVMKKHSCTNKLPSTEIFLAATISGAHRYYYSMAQLKTNAPREKQMRREVQERYDLKTFANKIADEIGYNRNLLYHEIATELAHCKSALSYDSLSRYLGIIRNSNNRRAWKLRMIKRLLRQYLKSQVSFKAV